MGDKDGGRRNGRRKRRRVERASATTCKTMTTRNKMITKKDKECNHTWCTVVIMTRWQSDVDMFCVCVFLPASKRAHCFIHNRTPVTTINNQTVRVYVCLQLTKLSSTKYLYYQLHRGNVCVKEYLYLGDHTLSTISVMFVLRILVFVLRWPCTINHQRDVCVENTCT